MRSTRLAAASLAAALLCTLTLAGCGGAEARRGGHMERGREYFAEENYEKARVEFRNALQVSPDDPEARFMSARVAEKLGNLRDAAGLYQSVIDVASGHVQARANMGRLFVFAGEPKRALETIEPVMATHPEDADLLTVRGAARVQLKESDAALADAEKAVKVAPHNENAVALLASLYRQRGENERAVQLIRTALEGNKSSVDLRQVLAALYSTLGEQGLSEEQLKEVVKLKPKELRHRQVLALSYVRAKKIDEGERVLADAVAALPDSLDAKLAYVDFLTANRSLDHGARKLREFIARDPKNYDLQLGLGALQQRANKVDEALATYRKVIDADPDGVKSLDARNRIAALYVVSHRFDEAAALVSEVLAKNPRDNDALVLRGNIALERNDPASAITDLRAVQRDQPGSGSILRSLARAHLANNEPALAEEALRSAMEVAPADAAARIELGTLLTQTGRAEQAVTILEETVNAAPSNMAAREALVRSYLSVKDLDAAKRSVEDLKLIGPDNASGYFLSGLVANAQQRPDDARRELEKALELQPTAMDVMGALTRLDLSRNRSDAALARLQAAAKANPENAIVQNLLGEVYLTSKQNANAIGPLSTAVKLAPKWWLPYRNLGIAKLAVGDTEGAIATYTEGVRSTDYQMTLVADLASLYERQNRNDDAIRQYEELHKRNPQSEVAANNLAMLLVTYRSDKASLDRARDLSAPFATSSKGAYLDTHGWVRFKRGEIEQALPALERAASESPDSSVVRFHLGMAQFKAGHRDKAKENLEKALQSGSGFSGADEARTVLAQLKGSDAG